jgi:large subunit ribosomal protein L15
MKIQDVHAPAGAHKRKKIVGRGSGSGHGKTSCRGQKGQLSRSGAKARPGFEGGQMPLIRRIPKRGFTNPFKKEFQVVNLQDLNTFAENEVVTLELLKSKNLIKKRGLNVKILGNGEIKKPLTVQANAFSKSAQEKISKAGGKAEIITSKNIGIAKSKKVEVEKA